jgi:hypothetical protein
MAQRQRTSNLGLKLCVGTLIALPLIGWKLEPLPVVWPPLGSIETYAAPLAATIIAVFGILPSVFNNNAATKKWMRIGVPLAICLAIISLFAYVCFLLTYVKGVETPNNGTQYRTVGSQRTVIAQHPPYSHESDAQILEIVGLTDGDIEKMWTPSSVREARLELFVTYLVGLMSINFVMGSLARTSTGSAQRQQSRKSRTGGSGPQ